MTLLEILGRITGTYPAKSTNQPTRLIRVERASVSMGDDCMAPNAVELECTEDERLSHFLVRVVDSLPAMRNSVWPVYYKKNVIAFISFDEKGEFSIERAVKNIHVWSIAGATLFCAYYYEGMLRDENPECGTLLEKVKRELEE